MIQKLALGAVGLVWFTLVFFFSLWMTFPEQAAIDRVRYEVQKATDGEINIDADGFSPMLTGLGGSVSGLEVHQIDRRKIERGDNDGAVSTLFAADSAWVKFSPTSLLSGAPSLWGDVTFGDGDLSFEVDTRNSERGMGIEKLDLDAKGFPVQSLPPIGGVSLVGTGELDLEVQLNAADGMRKADGEASLFGNNIVLSKVIAPDIPMLEGFDMVTEVSELELKFDIKSGRAKVKRGRLSSNLIDAELDGEIRLLEDLGRSTLRMSVIIDLGDELQMFSSFLSSALHNSDKKYHYNITGTLASPRFRADRERRSRPRNAAANRRNRNNNNADKDEDDNDSAGSSRKNASTKVDSRGLTDRTPRTIDRNVARAPITTREAQDYRDDVDEYEDDEEFDEEDEEFDEEDGPMDDEGDGVEEDGPMDDGGY